MTYDCYHLNDKIKDIHKLWHAFQLWSDCHSQFSDLSYVA